MDVLGQDYDIILKVFQDLETHDVEFPKKCAKIAMDIQEGSFTLLQLIEHLKDLLVNSMPSNREKGMVILSQVLELLPNEVLSAEHLILICAFYRDRLNDHHQVIPPVLKGILALTRYKNLPEGATKQILTSLFQNVPCQQQQQSDRLVIYKIIKTSLDNKFSEMLQMNIDFVYGVISAMDGERDPRNLLYLFNWLPKFLKTITLGHLSEEMFEVMACYFPVDFRAPSQDSDNISRDSLAECLCKCLCAISEFAEYCLPLALEKLASALRIAKLDSLNLIAEGCKTFDVALYIQHSTDICSQIQREVLQCSDSELEDTALTTLEIVLNKLSKSSTEVYEQMLSDIIDTLKGNLLPSGRLFLPSIKIIYHTAKSSKAATNFVISQIVPLLINTCNITTTPAYQVLLYKSLIDLVKVHIETHNSCNIVEVKELSLIPTFCIKAIFQEDNDVKAAGLTSLAVLSNSLPIDIRNRLYEYFCISLVMPCSKLIHQAALKCLRSLAQVYSKEVQENVLDKLTVNTTQDLKLYLEALIIFADIPDFTEIVLSVVLDHCLKDLETVEIATGALIKLLEMDEHNIEINAFLIERKQFIFLILNWFKNCINILDTSKHKDLLENVSKIFKILIGHQSSEAQYTTVSCTLESVLLLYESSQNTAVVIILDGLLMRIRTDVNISHNISDFLLEFYINSHDEYTCLIAVQLLANLLNKEPNEQILQTKLSKIFNTCTSILQQDDCKSKNVIELMSWVTKALIMRAHVESSTWTSKLLELLDTHEDVGKGFKIIMCDNYDCLSNSSYSNRRLLYQQKFFVETSNKISQKYNGENRNYLLAMGYLIQDVPNQVFILQFNKILRLVIMCLEHCEDEHVLCSILEALYGLIQSKESLMEQYLQEFLPRLLKLATFEGHMKVRSIALQCVQNYAIGFPVYKLLLHKQDVLLSLTQCLDDKKRLVRKEAVEARNRWFMIDAPV